MSEKLRVITELALYIWHMCCGMFSFIHSAYYAHAATNLISEYSKYEKEVRKLFLYNCTPIISCSADRSVSVA